MKFEDNPSPYLTVVETASAGVANPSAGDQKLIVDTDHLLKLKSSSGTVTPVGSNVIGTAHPGSPIAGSAPPSTGLIVQAGTAVGSSSPTTFTFPTAFPNGLLSVVATNGDGAANSGGLRITLSGTGVSQFIISSSVSGAFRFNWVAIGW